MERLKKYLMLNFEQVFVLMCLTTVALINYYLPQKIAFINFYFLPVIMAGYYLGLRRSVLGAFFCILMVIVYATLNPHLFVIPYTKIGLSFHIIAWGGFLILAGAVVGRQHEKLLLEIQETRRLNTELIESNRSVLDARSTTIFGLAKLAECRDEDTGAHLERIREFSRLLAQELSKKTAFKGYISQEYIDDIYQSSILHDIGKVGIPDAILLKPGKLDKEEFETIKNHTLLGGDALMAADDRVGGESFLTLGKEIAYHHHEKWDGTGYPKGLKGDKIPLSARIVSVADVYDALTSERPYKKAFSHDQSKRMIENEKGRHFDPELVDMFLVCEKEFNAIRMRLRERN